MKENQVRVSRQVHLVSTNSITKVIQITLPAFGLWTKFDGSSRYLYNKTNTVIIISYFDWLYMVDYLLQSSENIYFILFKIFESFRWRLMFVCRKNELTLQTTRAINGFLVKEHIFGWKRSTNACKGHVNYFCVVFCQSFFSVVCMVLKC